MAEPSLGSVGTPGTAVGLQQRGLSFVRILEKKNRCNADILREASTPSRVMERAKYLWERNNSEHLH